MTFSAVPAKVETVLRFENATKQRIGSFRLAHDQKFRLAAVAISSIHVNTWIGTYDKRTMSERLLERLRIAPDDIAQTLLAARSGAPRF